MTLLITPLVLPEGPYNGSHRRCRFFCFGGEGSLNFSRTAAIAVQDASLLLVLPAKMDNISYASSSIVDVVSAASGDRPVKVLPLVHPSPSSSRRPSAPFIGRWISRLQEMSLMEWIELFLPCTRWIRTYHWREFLQADLMAGVTVGIMLVPQVRYLFKPFLFFP